MLTYHETGNGPPVLLIHAFPLDGRMWQPQVAALSPTHHVIVPDLRGFGQTPLDTADHALTDHADDLAALMDALEIPRAAVVGLSMGGYISLALLRRHPQRIAALVLADTKATPDTADGRAARATNVELVQTVGVDTLAAKLLPGMVAPEAAVPVQTQILDLMRAQSPNGIAAAFRALAARPDSTDLLAGVSVPTLVIVGEQDTLTPPDVARELAAGIAGAQFALIPAAGHMTNLEQPEAFNQALLGFLNSL